MMNQGYPIVLTADRTLMADYRLLFDGMLAASQTSSVPPALLAGLLMPWPRRNGVRAAVAPLGLRRIEAALVAAGLRPDKIVVVDERSLPEAIGPATKIVAVSSGEPTGAGMNSSTMTGIAGGSIYPQALFRKLMKTIRQCVQQRAPKAKVVLGGPGAWQLAGDPDSAAALAVDHVVTGYAEGNVAQIFKAIIANEPLPRIIAGQPVDADSAPPIRSASTMGVVEVSRGCGLRCSFCTLAQTPMIHMPESTIVADARTNVAAGRQDIAALSEDFLRYGGHGVKANPQAVIAMLTRLRGIEGLRLIQTDHVNVSSVAQFSDSDLRTIRSLLVGNTGCRLPWVNVGVESASGELLRVNGCGAKMAGCDVPEWGRFAAEQILRLSNCGFLPMASLILGLPDEREDDLVRTLEWVKGMQDRKVTIFPMLYAPIDGSLPPTARSLSRLHWEIIRLSYRLNFKWTPRMYWDNQSATGVPLLRRALLQVMGRGQVLQWNCLFAWHGMRRRG